MKKMVGTILAVASLLVLVPSTASAGKGYTGRPLPPARNGGGASATSGGGAARPCGVVAAISGNCGHTALPPAAKGGKVNRGGLPPVRFGK